MAITKTSGALALSEIQTEFGGSNPIGLSEYYAGGSLVAAGTADGDGNAIPSSGNPISISNFYDTSNATFMVATGGNVTTDGDFKVHTFNSSGTFTISQTSGGQNTMQYLIIAGGGGGGVSNASGAGAGGRLLNTGFTEPSTGDYAVTVGGGGAGGPLTPPYGKGSNGSDSTWNSITATGGGGGGGWAGTYPNASPQAGGDGGSGGGSNQAAAGNGISGQGNGGARYDPMNGGGGGGGAGSSGSARNGGSGASSSITGSSVTKAGGGAGRFGSAGSGGGGAPEQAGTGNTGGGGGAWNGNVPYSHPGGSGIVIFRYKFQ